MKLIGFWLLVLLAVLVPATATIAASMMCPPAVLAKQSPSRVHAAQAGKATQHAAVKSASHARVAKVKPVEQHLQQVKQLAAHDQQADPCCDANPCSHCASCGSCASMAAIADVSPPAHVLALSVLPEPGHPRAEFLLSGQERPPRLV